MIITCYGGPAHGRRFDLEDERVCFLRHDGGHYARVQGGLKTDFYWRPFGVPIAVSYGGRLHPVLDKKRGASE